MGVPMLIDEADLQPLVECFYARVRADQMLAPVFASAVDDWPAHEARIGDFWSSVMNTSGRYKGSPVAKHLRLAGQITPEHFSRWLQLWRETSNELLPPAGAAAVQAKADRIAESLQLAIQYAPSDNSMTASQRSSS